MGAMDPWPLSEGTTNLGYDTLLYGFLALKEVDKLER